MWYVSDLVFVLRCMWRKKSHWLLRYWIEYFDIGCIEDCFIESRSKKGTIPTTNSAKSFLKYIFHSQKQSLLFTWKMYYFIVYLAWNGFNLIVFNQYGCKKILEDSSLLEASNHWRIRKPVHLSFQFVCKKTISIQKKIARICSCSLFINFGCSFRIIFHFQLLYDMLIVH